MLILFSLELRDITQETEYVMNFDPCDPSVFIFGDGLKLSIRDNRFVIGSFLEIQSLKSLS